MAAARLGCHVVTIRRYAHRFPRVKKALAEGEARLVDLGEGVILSHLRKGSLKAAMFVLSRKGRARGWGANLEIEGAASADKPVIVVPMAEFSSPQEWAATFRGLREAQRTAQASARGHETVSGMEGAE